MLRLLLTGRPGCGKTTLLSRIALHFPDMVCGFLTYEVRRNKKRFGFAISPLSLYTTSSPLEALPKTVFASVEIRSRIRVGKYGVDVARFEMTAIPEMEKSLNQDRKLVIIDEIGKMELASSRFREMLDAVFRTRNVVLASVHAHKHPYTDELKSRPDVLCWSLTPANREEIFEEVLNLVCGGMGFAIRPTGFLRTPWKECEGTPRQPEAVPASIEILPPYLPATQNLKPNTTVHLLWFAHKASRAITHYEDAQKTKGVFSTRSPNRPNPIALSTVKIVSVDGFRITVDRADAITGSPLLDIKPVLKDDGDA